MGRNRPSGETHRNSSPWECPRCCALPGRPCTYLTTSAWISLGERHVEHEAGEPMTRMHRERPRIRCIPIGGETP